MPARLDLYGAPTLILLFVLVAVFGTLWMQRRTLPPLRMQAGEGMTARRRQLLWLVGWMFVAIQLEMEVFGRGQAGLWLAVSRCSGQLAALMFLGSLAPQYIAKKPRVHYVVAFGTPLMVFTAIVTLNLSPGAAERTVLLVCALAVIAVGVRWSLDRYLLPVWLSLMIVTGFSGSGLWMIYQRQYGNVLGLVESGVLLTTALLFASAFRRLTPGVVFTVGGLVAWSLPGLLGLLIGAGSVPIVLVRALNLMKVIAAVGMIVLVLEDEIASNKSAQLRDRRARLEMERYTEVFLEAMPIEEDTRQYDQICEAIAAASRFRQATILVRGPEGRFRMAGRAGIDGALGGALDALARRTTDLRVKEIGRDKLFRREIGHLVLLDLKPLMEPGDELLQLNFLEAHVIAIRGRDGEIAGALLMAGLRDPEDPVLTEDVLPLELLVARIGAAREHQMLLRRLLQAERLAGLGQLAGGVAHELNNPLTVITGYAELMADTDNPQAHDQAAVILNEARRMKQIIESLVRFRKATPGNRSPVSVAVLLQDVERLARHDLESTHIELQIEVAAGLPPVKADGDQVRQVFLQVVKNAIGSMADSPEGIDRRLIVETVANGDTVRITFSDNGPGFAAPARAFDPFYTTRHQGEGVGLGLSICYSIIREHGGQISAVNLLPRGAAVVIELPVNNPEAAEPIREPEPVSASY
jgi:two-component system, NtrC family, sensor kinase